MSDNPYVRVLDTTTGHEQSVHQSVVDSIGPDVLTPVLVDGEPARAVDLNGDPLPPTHAAPEAAPSSAGRSGPTVAQMREVIDRRNAGRGEDDQIEVAAPGNKPELIAALEADDQAHGLTYTQEI